MRLNPHIAAVYMPTGLPPAPPYQGRPGFFRQGNLPETLERLGKAGLRDFYEGEIAASIAADIKAVGGVLSLDDLRGFQAGTSVLAIANSAPQAILALLPRGYTSVSD